MRTSFLSFILITATSFAPNVMVHAGKVRKLRTPAPLRASIYPYPEYTGDLVISGDVTVSFPDETSTDMTFIFDLSSVEANCVDCGIHIHQGTSCDTDLAPMGHYWNHDVLPVDPWTSVNGAAYNSDSDGNASGSFPLYSGLNKAENDGHAVVVHTAGGVRIGCGVLSFGADHPCADSDERTVQKGRNSSNQNKPMGKCAWLQRRLLKFPNVCYKRPGAIKTCPETCGVCGMSKADLCNNLMKWKTCTDAPCCQWSGGTSGSCEPIGNSSDGCYDISS